MNFELKLKNEILKVLKNPLSATILHFENYDGMYFTKKKFIIARNNDNFILEEHNKSFNHFVRQDEISTIDQCVEFIKKSFYDFEYTKGIYSGYEILNKDATTFLFFGLTGFKKGL